MRIGILTYHACYNYGANLQAYALQQVLLNLGHECKIIDYQNQKLKEVNSVLNFHIDNKFDIAFLIYNLFHFISMKKRKNKFESFINQNFQLSSHCRTDKEVAMECENYDVVICGSDQIWNTNPGIKYHSMIYFLNFPKTQKRISYAGSFGTNVKFYSDSVKKEALYWLAKFDHLLVREPSAVDFLINEKINAKQVLDPTLLLDVTDYEKIMRAVSVKEPYMISLNWNGRRFVSDLAFAVSKKLNFKVINPVSHPRNIFNHFNLMLDVGPREFLGLVNNSRLIVSSSFHAIVFAIQFRKPFIAVMNNKEHDFTTTDDRLVSLLGDLGLSENIAYDINDVDLEKIMHMDYDAVHEKLSKCRKESINLLINALNN